MFSFGTNISSTRTSYFSYRRMNGAVKIKSLDGFFVEDVRNDSKDFIGVTTHGRKGKMPHSFLEVRYLICLEIHFIFISNCNFQTFK
jgi:hypothetical protein